jgi:hypothetical protein
MTGAPQMGSGQSPRPPKRQCRRAAENKSAYPNLMRRLGLVPEDNAFNRRAAAYVLTTQKLANGRLRDLKGRLRKKYAGVVIGEKK